MFYFVFVFLIDFLVWFDLRLGIIGKVKYVFFIFIYVLVFIYMLICFVLVFYDFVCFSWFLGYDFFFFI